MSQQTPRAAKQTSIDSIVTWKEDGTWRTEEVLAERDDCVIVSVNGEERRINRDAATVAPISPFKNSPHPRDLVSRSFMNAVREVVDSYGIDKDCVTIIWCDDRPYCTFPPSVPDGTIQSIRREVDDLTNADIEPEQTDLTCLRM